MCIAFRAFRARYHLEQKQENNGEDKDNVQDTLVFGTGAVEKKKIIGGATGVNELGLSGSRGTGFEEKGKNFQDRLLDASFPCNI